MSAEAVHVVPSRAVADNLAKVHGEGAGIAPLAAPCSWDLALDAAPLERWPELWTSRLSEPLPTDEDIRASEREALARSIRLLEGASGQIELWHAGTLHDVLFLVSAAALLDRIGVAPERVLLRWGAGSGLGLEVHDPDELAAIPAEPLGAERWAWLQQAWTALLAPTPGPLLALLREPAAPALGPLPARLGLLLTRYPDAASGLTRWDRKLLEAAREHADPDEAHGARVIGTLIGDAPESWDSTVGDVTLLARLAALAGRRRPLVAVRGLEGGLRAVRVGLTDLGRRVLAGELNALDLGDYRDRVANVELDTERGRVWCYDGETLVEWSAPAS